MTTCFLDMSVAVNSWGSGGFLDLERGPWSILGGGNRYSAPF